VVTSHAGQGKTADRVLVALSSLSFSASGREQFDVSVSRGRESVTVYTDNTAGLRRAIERADPHRSATELVRPAVQARAVWRAWVKCGWPGWRSGSASGRTTPGPRAGGGAGTMTAGPHLHLPAQPDADRPTEYAAYGVATHFVEVISMRRLRFADDTWRAFPYHGLTGLHYDPGLGIELAFVTTTIRLTGRNLFPLIPLLSGRGVRSPLDAPRRVRVRVFGSERVAATGDAR
jgi:hypothetical protein